MQQAAWYLQMLETSWSGFISVLNTATSPTNITLILTQESSFFQYFAFQRNVQIGFWSANEPFSTIFDFLLWMVYSLLWCDGLGLLMYWLPTCSVDQRQCIHIQLILLQLWTQILFIVAIYICIVFRNCVCSMSFILINKSTFSTDFIFPWIIWIETSFQIGFANKKFSRNQCTTVCFKTK